MKIIELKAENVKRLRAIHLKPNGESVVIGGQNEQGKSTVLDSILYALGGGKDLPEQPIRTGEKRAEITVDLGELVVTRRFTESGSTLVVKTRDGDTKSSPQSILDKMVGKLTFDPLQFARMEAKPQREVLAKLVGLDFASVNAEYQRLYDRRRDANREVERFKTLLFGKTEVPNLPEAEIAVDSLLADLGSAQAVNKSFEDARAVLNMADAYAKERVNSVEIQQKAVIEAEARLQREREVLKVRQDELVVAQEKLSQASAAFQAATTAEEAPIKAAILDAQTKNTIIRANQAIRKQKADLEQAEKQAKALDEQCQAQLDKKAELIRNATFPLPGLSVTDDAVVFESLPLKQASTAQQIKISSAIGIALNPTLRVMLIREGSLLDDVSLTALHEMARDNDIQLWIERVGKGEEVSVVIADGSVIEDRTNQ